VEGTLPKGRKSPNIAGRYRIPYGKGDPTTEGTMRGFSVFVETLILIGAINWGLIGFFDFNLVGAIFGPTLSRIIYAIVGVAALYEIFAWKRVHESLAPRVAVRNRA
jgi:uncharacterized membrane protein YuzA (DUF378 family)